MTDLTVLFVVFAKYLRVNDELLRWQMGAMRGGHTMQIAISVGEHGTRIQRKQSSVELTHIYVHFGKFGPCQKLTRRAIDSLSSQLEGPVKLPLATEEVTLDMEESICHWMLTQGGRHYIHSFNFLVYKNGRIRSPPKLERMLNRKKNSLIPM